MSEIILTPSEYKVALLIYEKGMNNEEIASELQIKKRTVECHINRIYDKCYVDSIRKFYVVMRNQKIIGKRKNAKQCEVEAIGN
jgi:DNA-binding NarL/FixJ family response regulator